MEHYYVMNGNEYGMNLATKRNFILPEDAKEYFDKVKNDDFGCVLMYVGMYGSEQEIELYYDGME
jgi:hypothetical protein